MTKMVCREYYVYQADIQGSFWNKSESEIQGSGQRIYRLESQTVPFRNIDFSNGTDSGDAFLDAIVDTVDSAARMSNVLNMCRNSVMTLRSVRIPLSATRCAQ